MWSDVAWPGVTARISLDGRSCRVGQRTHTLWLGWAYLAKNMQPPQHAHLNRLQILY
jgi:hypothetical protein